MYGMDRGVNMIILDGSPSLSSTIAAQSRLQMLSLVSTPPGRLCQGFFFRSTVYWPSLRLSFHSFLYVILPPGTKEFEKKAELGPCMQRDGEIAVVEYRRSCQK